MRASDVFRSGTHGAVAMAALALATAAGLAPAAPPR